MIEQIDKYYGLFGGASLGDILGKPVEGWSAEQINRYVPGGRGITEPIKPFYVTDAEGNISYSDHEGKKLKYYSIHLDVGFGSDDEALTLGLGEAIARARGLNLQIVAEEHLKAVDERSALDPTGRAAFGLSTLEATGNMRKGIPLDETATSLAPGNGPGMKMAPVALYIDAIGRRSNYLDYGEYMRAHQEGIAFARTVGEMTHRDPRSIVSGMLQTHLALVSMMSTTNRDGFITEAVEFTRQHEQPLTEVNKATKYGSMLDKIVWVSDNRNAEVDEAVEVIGNNSAVYRSYPFTLFMVQKYWNSPLEGLLATVNAGGDCDTTGAMYGALMGARVGIKAFPQEWVNLLHYKDRLFKAAEGIYALGEKRIYG